MRVNSEDTEWDESLLVTYRGEPYTGEVVETDRQGAVLGLTSYIGGRQNGLGQRWYPGGRLRAELVADMGKVIGTAREWHPNGQLASEKVFAANGHLVEVRQWDENGAPVERSSRSG